MKTHCGLILSLGTLALTSGCGDDMMSMSDQLEGLASHQMALEGELTLHHRDVLDAATLAQAGSFEPGFGRRALEHMDEMDHRMRDMQSMCSMNGRGFDGAPMSETMGRVRTALGEHQQRMYTAADLAATQAEETSFRDAMTALMTEMHGGESALRSSAAGYTCHMRGHWR